MWQLRASRCFGNISCYCHVGGAPHKNVVISIIWMFGWQGGESLFQMAVRLQAPGEWGTCALESYLCWEGTLPTDLPSNVTWLWDYAESHVARQGKPAYLCRQLATVTWGRTVSPHLGLCYWWQKGCCGILLMWLACFWYPVSIIQKDLGHCAWHKL